MYCNDCGTEIPPGARFCQNCGLKLQSGVTTGPTAPQTTRPQTPEPQNLASKPSPINARLMALFSLFLGISCVLLADFVGSIYIVLLGVAAILFGHTARWGIRRSGDRLGGNRMAVAGLVLGYGALVLVIGISMIAIPNLLRSRTAANEASAMGSMRTINNSQVTYAATFPDVGFTCSLADLGGAGGKFGGERLIDATLASGQKNGYKFLLVGCGDELLSLWQQLPSNRKWQAMSAEQQAAYRERVWQKFASTLSSPENSTPLRVPSTVYVLIATPDNKQTGNRAFCSDQTGIIRYSLDGSAEECLMHGHALE